MRGDSSWGIRAHTSGSGLLRWDRLGPAGRRRWYEFAAGKSAGRIVPSRPGRLVLVQSDQVADGLALGRVAINGTPLRSRRVIQNVSHCVCHTCRGGIRTSRPSGHEPDELTKLLYPAVSFGLCLRSGNRKRPDEEDGPVWPFVFYCPPGGSVPALLAYSVVSATLFASVGYF